MHLQTSTEKSGAQFAAEKGHGLSIPKIFDQSLSDGLKLMMINL